MSPSLTRHAVRRAFTLLELMIVLGVILILASLVLGVGSAFLRGAERAQLEAAMEVVDKACAEWDATTGRPISFVGRVAGVGGAVGNDPLFSAEADVRRFDIREADYGTPAAGGGQALPNGLTTEAARAVARAQGVGVYCINLLMQADFTKEQIATIPPGLIRAEPNVATGNFWPTSITGYPPSLRSGVSRGEFIDPWGRRVAFVFPGRPFRWGADQGLPDEDGTVRTSVEQVLGSCVARRICLVSAGPDGVFGPETNIVANRATAAADNISLYPLLPPNSN